MLLSRLCALGVCGIGAFLFGQGSLSAQISVTGVVDETVYTDRVTFSVPAAAGYDYDITLDGKAVPAGVPVLVDQPNYYELSVTRRPTAGGAEEQSLVQFIVRASARGNAEWGLPSWVPYLPIDSAAAEFAGAELHLIAPAAYPQGLEVPVVAWVRNAAGKRAGVNGQLRFAGFEGSSLRLLRGVGHAFLPAATSAGDVVVEASLHSIQAQRTVAIDAATTWTALSGTLSASRDFGEDARISVTGGVTIDAGATLTFGAGSVVRLAAGADITVNGAVAIQGSTARPVVFLPADRGAPWGGFILRGASARIQASGAIFTGSGANPDWFDEVSGAGSSHKDEQACIYLSGGARAELTDCAIIDNRGQAGHGESSFLTMTRTLVQRAVTTGQYNGGSVQLADCALIEFPAFDAPFADDDNDGLYLTGGSHSLTDCLIGWALDDGVDAGSGSAGPVTVAGCWFESSYHEGMAWSEGRLPTVRDTVAMNNGQGIECGFGEPMVDAARILSTANLTGARFGDNYDWDYNGNLRLEDSLVLYNYRDVFGRAWDNWDVHLDQMEMAANLVTIPDPLFPENALWDPAADAARLAPFLPTPAAVVGVGLALRDGGYHELLTPGGLPVRLSTFTTREVSVGYEVHTEDGLAAEGRVTFVPGQTVRGIDLSAPGFASAEYLRVVIKDPAGAEITGLSEYERLEETALIARGAVWRYLDTNVFPGAGWTALEFDDASWPSGAAELGDGDDDEETPIDIGPDDDRYPAVYFRRRFEVDDPAAFASLRLGLRRDDGAVVYLNGAEVMRSNMPAGPIEHGTFADSSSSSEDDYFPAAIDPALLRAGENVIAVEVHQANATSSDLSFDLELFGLRRPGGPPTGEPRFVRGDANDDGNVDVSDPVRILVRLFAGGAPFACDDAADANDDGGVTLADAVYVLDFLFRRGAAPSPSSCGVDAAADALDCAAPASCP
jgi:hypothetical protein